MVAHLRVPGDGPHDLTIDPAADVPDVLAHDAAGHDDGHAWNGGLDALDVGVSEAVLQNVALAAFVGNFLFLGWFDAAEDDVLAAEVFDQFLRFEACAFANRQHRDDRTDAEDDPEHGEEGTE